MQVIHSQNLPPPPHRAYHMGLWNLQKIRFEEVFDFDYDEIEDYETKVHHSFWQIIATKLAVNVTPNGMGIPQSYPPHRNKGLIRPH